MAVVGKVMPIPKGQYDPVTTYDILDIVTHNDRAWICKAPNVVGIEPNENNSIYWMLLINSAVADALTLDGHDVAYFAPQETIDKILDGNTAVGNSLTLDGHDVAYFAPQEVIDEILNGNTAVGNSLNLGGHPSTYFASVESVEALTASDVDAAPTGYGLGETNAKNLTNADDLNTIRENGWYTWYVSKSPLNAPPCSTACNMLVISRSADVTVQVVFKLGDIIPTTGLLARDNNRIMMRTLYNDYVGEWEYVNPPTDAGIEYRTTERFLGKPVYVQLINFGKLPNNAKLKVEHGIEGIEHVVDYSATAKYPNATSIVLNGHAYINYVSVMSNAIEVQTTTDLSGYDTWFVIKYTKTTD